MKIAGVFTILIAFVFVTPAQKAAGSKPVKLSQSESLALKAFEAHGGEKLGALKSLAIRGSVDITSSAANQAIPASFVQIFAGEKYRLEVDGGFVQFVQTFDGINTVTSPSRGFELPPINRIGIALLQRLGQEGFEVSAADNEKKAGFRITSPEGYFTDFYVSKKTNRIKSYDASYVVSGREVTTLVEIDKLTEIEGLILPSKFAQKFEVSGMTIYALFKAKEILVNEEMADDLFSPGG